MSPKEARIWRRILRNTSFQSGGCFEWTGMRDKNGYGMISVNGDSRRVPRVVMWLLAEMPLMGELPVLHHCDNPPCWNPEHIYVGTYSENTRDAVRRGRIQARQGSRSSQAKLNEEIVYGIKTRLRAGEPQAQIARSTSISKQIINDIAIGKTWAHVQLPHSPLGTYCETCGTELFPSYTSRKRRIDCRYCYKQTLAAA